MKILLSGSSGFVGSSLSRFLSARGHEVLRLTRSSISSLGTIGWNPETGETNLTEWEGLDAIVHLAGENLQGRWTREKKRRILDSRVVGTRNLSRILSKLSRRPKVFACASAIGFYGDRGQDILDETSASGSGFLSEVCRQWESAANEAGRFGVRVVNLRFGMILSPAGGALAKLLMLFRFGLGGRVGNGRQYLSWVTLPDVLGATEHVLSNQSIEGPINVVAPEPVTNREFARTLGHVIRRPAVLPMPASVVRLIMGEMGNELLLWGARVYPRRLADSGYAFTDRRLEEALSAMLKGGRS